MRISRVLAILEKDLLRGPKSFFFFQAVLTPLLCALIVTVLFGSALSGKPRVGFFFEGKTELRVLAEEVDFLRFSEYESVSSLQADVASGRLDIGLIIAEGFDELVKRGDSAYLKSYVWGESLLRKRAMIFAGLSDVFIRLAGKEVRVDVKTVILGGGGIQPLGQRFLPLLVLLAIVMSGMMIPSSTIVDEKQRGTLTAMEVTPVSFGEVVTAKCLFGFVISLLMGVIIIALSGSTGPKPGLLVLALAMTAAFASTIGGLFGIMASDVNSLMTLFKSLMMFLYLPGILRLFPKVPEWIARLMPTYYIFSPIIEVSQNSAGLRDIGFDLLILTGLIIAMVAVVYAVGKKRGVRTA